MCLLKSETTTQSHRVSLVVSHTAAINCEKRIEIAEWFTRAILTLQLRRDKNCIELLRQK